MVRICCLFAAVAIMIPSGCHAWTSKEKEKNNQFIKETKRFKDLLSDPERPRLVGEVAAALGLSARHYDAYGLVSDLPGTGGVVKPGVQRDLILAEMRIRDVENPETVLDAPWTALVKLKVFANPCDEKGEILDVDVETSTECLATSIVGGTVLEAKLREMAYIEGNMRTSDDKAIASGEVVILPASYTKAQESETLKGVIVGGGRLSQEQRLGLRIDPEYRHVVITKAIEKAINTRYFYRNANRQQLVAEGKNDWHVVLQTIPRYKQDPYHFMSVILATGFAEDEAQQQERVEGCKKLLMNRETARRGAIELEAIGNDAAKQVLIETLQASDPEIRFYAAYSLSYLDSKQAVPTLVELAKTEPAFRANCLTGLSIDEDPYAREALEELLQESEPEVRFGAYLAIRNRNATDFVVNGESIGNRFQLVQIPSSTPLVAISVQKKKEIVLFGSSIKFTLREQLAPTPSLRVSPAPGDQIKISKRHSNGDTSHCVVTSDLVSVLRAMGKIDASYNDTIHTLDVLANKRLLASPVAINPRPLAGREYNRKGGSSASAKVETSTDIIKVDGSTVSKPETNSLGWLVPASWFKTNKSASRKSMLKETSAIASPELSDEELALVNP
jgi:hypothetical protein